MTGAVVSIVSRVRRRLRLRGRRTGGFLMLEALVAVSIMAFLLTVLPQGVVLSRRSVEKSADVIGARLVAEAVMVVEFENAEIEPGSKRGTMDGYDWATLVEPNEDLLGRFKSKQWTPYDVIVQVSVPDGPLVTLETIRLGRGK